MNHFFEHLCRRLRPTEHERTVTRWRADDGDRTLRLDYDLTPDSLALDLGGYRGQWAHDLYERHRCRIIVFEPVPAFAHAIAERFAHNDKVCVNAFGLGSATRTATINVNDDASSLFDDAPSGESVQVRDAADWFTEEGVSSIQLMKVNIEGAEYELLERMIEADLIQCIENLQIQFHNTIPDAPARMAAIQSRLSQTHRVTYQYRFVWENWTRL